MSNRAPSLSYRPHEEQYNHLRDDSTDFQPYSAPPPHETYDQGAYEGEYRDEPQSTGHSGDLLDRSKEAVIANVYEPNTYSTCVYHRFFISRCPSYTRLSFVVCSLMDSPSSPRDLKGWRAEQQGNLWNAVRHLHGF
jgi:hypothetical protein